MDKWITAMMLMGLFVVAGAFLPSSAKDPNVLSLLSYNIHHGVDFKNNYNLTATADTIQLTGADIIALQEVDIRWGLRSHMLDQISWLASRLMMESAFAPALTNKSGFYGVGILSKYPIIYNRYYLLPGKLEQRVLQVAGIQVNGQTIYLFNTHLGLSQGDRTVQVAKILEIAQMYESEHKILLGDFNTVSDAPELTPLAEYFHAEINNLSTGLHETLVGGKRKIDTIFISPSLIMEKIATLVFGASDHFPLWAQIRVP